MTPEQFTQAKPLIEVLSKLNAQIAIAEEICFQIDNTPEHPEANNGFTGGYKVLLREWPDGSGKMSLDLTGCWVANKVYKATLQILIEQRDDIMKKLEAI